MSLEWDFIIIIAVLSHCNFCKTVQCHGLDRNYALQHRGYTVFFMEKKVNANHMIKCDGILETLKQNIKFKFTVIHRYI